MPKEVRTGFCWRDEEARCSIALSIMRGALRRRPPRFVLPVNYLLAAVNGIVDD